MGGFCHGGGFCPLHILSVTTYILLWQWLYFWGFCPGRILSREDFVLYLWNSMVSLIIYGILEYFFPREDFVPEEDFVLIIFSPLILTFSCCKNWILEDFVPGGFYSREDFVPYPCNPLLCNNCILEDFESRKILSRENFVLSLCPLSWSTFSLT